LHGHVITIFSDLATQKSPPRELPICFTMSKLGLKLLLKRKNNTTLGKKPALW